jgi:hypothetical protein
VKKLSAFDYLTIIAFAFVGGELAYYAMRGLRAPIGMAMATNWAFAFGIASLGAMIVRRLKP